MSGSMAGAPPEAEPPQEAEPEGTEPLPEGAGAQASRGPGRAWAIGGVAVAVVVGMAFGQLTGKLSDTVTGVRDMGGGESAGVRAAGRQEVPDPPTSLPPTSLTTTITVAASPTTSVTAAPANAAVATTTTTEPAGPLVPEGVMFGPGAQGPAVRRLQQRLAELGYWPGLVDGNYGEPTRQAVRAFQKAEGLDRQDGLADAEVGRRLAVASFTWGRSRSGTVVEVDRGRQLLLVVEDGAVRWTLDAATGPLPPGRHTVEREIDGHYEAPAGTVHRPRYFDGSVAIQGTGAAPHPPAQGCACVGDAAMDFLWSTGAVGVGTPVLVY